MLAIAGSTSLVTNKGSPRVLRILPCVGTQHHAVTTIAGHRRNRIVRSDIPAGVLACLITNNGFLVVMRLGIITNRNRGEATSRRDGRPIHQYLIIRYGRSRTNRNSPLRSTESRERRCAMTDCDGSIRLRNGTNSSGQGIYACRAIVVVVRTNDAVVINAVVVRLGCFELRHVYCVAIGRTRGYTGDLAELVIACVPHRYSSQGALGGTDCPLLNGRCIGRHVTRLSCTDTGDRIAA